MAKKTYTYHDAACSSYGLMLCGACGRKITEGQYRVRETTDKYITIHRHCSLDDPNWTRLDNEAEANRLENEEFIAACKAFRDQWNISDLDHYIGESY